MSVPSDSTTVKYSVGLYHEDSPHVELGPIEVTALLSATATPDDMDGYARAGMQAVVDALAADFPTLTVSASCTYDRATAGTSVTPSP